MNYLAAMIVRVIGDEEESFWVFTNLFETILPIDYFCLMTEILVDQKILIQILQKKKTKLFKHLQNIGLDFAIISFQWLVCLLSANLIKEVAETIWDFLFLEGSVAIFRAIMGILTMLEDDLLQQDDFSELYQILDSKPKEMINSPEELISNMVKFRYIKQKSIDRSREKYRPLILEEQRSVWSDNSSADLPHPSDSSLFKRVKLLNKFFLLSKAMRNSREEALVNANDASITLKDKIK
mmetsp:Transcript_32778/g.37472  ORF Transcript_32778/g.37472 Transcript_32778/m.37472 type:complete len:239 (+) Transcript_32778:805-1521(+)